MSFIKKAGVSLGVAVALAGLLLAAQQGGLIGVADSRAAALQPAPAAVSPGAAAPSGTGTTAPPAQPAAAATTAAATASAGAGKTPSAELPDESSFKLAAESQTLRLLADSASGHFKVEDKRNGRVYRSYPDPAFWPKETITGTWRNNLRSPMMLGLLDMGNPKAQPKIVSLIEDKGTIDNFKTIEGGFSLTFNFKTSGFKIPVEVKVNGDAVETRIIDSGIEEGKLSLLNLKLYPMFGAAPSTGGDGYLLIPDGSGALIDFKENKTNDFSVYWESIYGSDVSFFNDNVNRLTATMPVFGLKAGASAFVGIMEGGEEYVKLFASPSGAYGSYNWITPEQQYRIKFFQNTSQKRDTGFYTYSKQMFKTTQRVTKYYLLDGQTDYVGMASRYRDYLMQEKGLKRMNAVGSKVPMFVDIVGADKKKGALWDKYLKGTSTSEAMEMVKRLYGLGIEKMSIGYFGWQEGGYSQYGGVFPVDQRLGGNEGMKQFVRFAHSLQMPVFLAASYTMNNTDKDGFNAKYDGLRNLAGRVLTFENRTNKSTTTLVSPKYAAEVVGNDLPTYKELGVDGIYFEDGIGRYLNSDFNDRYAASRTEGIKVQQSILQQTREALGGVSVERPNFYSIGQITHMHRMEDDYSYDLFVDRAVPFAQIAVHGLLTYTSEWSNVRDQYRSEFLRSIEYGSYPSYIFTAAASRDMKGAYSLWYYSMNYRDWEASAVEEYQRYNQALGDVQNQFIVGHRILSPGVFETTYEGGKRLVVNYGTAPYSGGGLQVPAQDFVVIPGGGAK